MGLDKRMIGKFGINRGKYKMTKASQGGNMDHFLRNCRVNRNRAALRSIAPSLIYSGCKTHLYCAAQGSPQYPLSILNIT
jgi:hypothetical protein